MNNTVCPVNLNCPDNGTVKSIMFLNKTENTTEKTVIDYITEENNKKQSQLYQQAFGQLMKEAIDREIDHKKHTWFLNGPTKHDVLDNIMNYRTTEIDLKFTLRLPHKEEIYERYKELADKK